MLYKVGQCMPRFEGFQHGTAHTSIGNKKVEVADLSSYCVRHCLEIILFRNIAYKRHYATGSSYINAKLLWDFILTVETY